MKTWQKITACVVATTAIIATCSANLLSISEQEINRYLETKLPEKAKLQDKVGIPNLFQLDYKISNLATKIGQTEAKRVEIAGIIEANITASGKQRQAQIQLNLDTVPYYDPEKGALFLKDVRLTSWQASPEKYRNELQMFLPVVAEGIAGILNNTPVYTLDESKTKEALVKKFGKAIVVEKGELRLETAIF